MPQGLDHLAKELAQVCDNDSQHLALVEGHGPHLLGSPSPLLLLPSPSPLLLLPKAHRAACHSRSRY